MTVRENFSAWWRIYQRFGGNKGVIQRHYEFLDRILPGRVKSIPEWMEKTGYTADHRPLLIMGESLRDTYLKSLCKQCQLLERVDT
jgi:hypothetical protein